MWWAFAIQAFLTLFMIFSEAAVAFAVTFLVMALLPWVSGEALTPRGLASVY